MADECLHSVQLELEAVGKQIRDLEQRQAQLRERRAALESSRADAHKSGARCTQDAIFPDVLHCDAGTPRTLGASTAEDASRVPGDDISPSCLRDLHPEPLRSPPRDRTRRCDHRRLHRPTHTRDPEGRREPESGRASRRG
ncbi:uncharacterized protein LOC127935857 isoform X2 [Carassius gibelio]|uniref:uncharacterized protein LOC127935857 isoform X2 n=1 Tax=Carassius gibelio TaxID=101364 RepID=UPI0022774F7E|nr:uncharacterized protein LOC127935857 isoform X2 [Carassius gibelio]